MADRQDEEGESPAHQQAQSIPLVVRTPVTHRVSRPHPPREIPALPPPPSAQRVLTTTQVGDAMSEVENIFNNKIQSSQQIFQSLPMICKELLIHLKADFDDNDETIITSALIAATETLIYKARGSRVTDNYQEQTVDSLLFENLYHFLFSKLIRKDPPDTAGHVISKSVQETCINSVNNIMKTHLKYKEFESLYRLSNEVVTLFETQSVQNEFRNEAYSNSEIETVRATLQAIAFSYPPPNHIPSLVDRELFLGLQDILLLKVDCKEEERLNHVIEDVHRDVPQVSQTVPPSSEPTMTSSSNVLPAIQPPSYDTLFKT